MADRGGRRRGIALVGLLTGAVGAGIWWYLRRPSGPVTDQWARATSTPTPLASTEPVAAPAATTAPAPAADPGVADSDEAPKPTDMPATSSVEPVGAAVEEQPSATEAPEPTPARPATLFDATTPSVDSGFTPSRGTNATPTDDSPTLAIPAVNPKEPYGPGSAAPLADGSAPGPEYTIKGNASSMLFHPPSSPYFERTKPEAWFRTPEDAEKAGFIEWRPKPRA